jgi:phage terminase large subunit
MSADAERRAVLATPAGFAEGILGVKLYDWQRAVLNELELPGMISVRCCNEAGKTTAIAAPAILWVMGLFPGAQVVVTSGAWRQVRHQLFPAVARFRPKLPGWDIHDTTIKSPRGSTCVGFSTDDAGLFEGFHVGPGGHRETPLLIIVDEAKSVDEAIFQAIDRCRPTWLLMLSSPGAKTGRFYRSHSSERSHSRVHKVDASMCPHIDQATIQGIIDRYGRDHWFVRSSIDAEFSDDGVTGEVIPLGKLEACIENPVAPMKGVRHAFCDFAAGRDENVLALREGNRVRIVRAWREPNTMAAVGEFIATFRKLELEPHEITGDADGLGSVFLDRLAELGWSIGRFHGGSPAVDKHVYANAAAECWGKGAEQIDRRAVHLPADDAKLIEQLTSRRWKRRSDGTALLESKDEMRARGLNSPDRADAVLGAMLEHLAPPPDRRALGVLEQWQDRSEVDVLAGFNAGG